MIKHAPNNPESRDLPLAERLNQAVIIPGYNPRLSLDYSTEEMLGFYRTMRRRLRRAIEKV